MSEASFDHTGKVHLHTAREEVHLSNRSVFEWVEYDALLEQIASTDVIDAEWSRLRDMIKSKIEKNIAQYLSNPPRDETAAVHAASLGPIRNLQGGGLKLPPFTPRIRLEGNPNEAPKHVLDTREANEFKEIIFGLLDQFDGPPFTIQRVCELCLHPEKHYKYIGKYLRAMEKSLLVTSTWDAFPISEGDANHSVVAPPSIGGAMLSTPATPIFSPIPFLHADARRSQSRSPPPSPLALTALGGVVTTTLQPGAEGAEPKALGLVDELDDPNPEHLSDHLQPLSSTTTVDPKPIPGSLESRFVRVTSEGGSNGETRGGSEQMVVDEGGNKEPKSG